MSRKPGATRKPVKTTAPPPPKKPQASRGNAWFQQHQAVAVDSLSRMLAEPGSSLLTWAVIGIAMALPVCLLLFLQNFRQLNTSLEEAGNISLFMQYDISRVELEAVGREIEAMAGVAEVKLVTADEALTEFQDASGFGNALDGLDENPLPALVIVRPASDLAPDVRELAARMEAMPQVAAAQVDLEWLQRLYAIISLAQRFTVGLAALLALGVVLAIGNTVRLAIENRRDEILVVKLVGGTDAYVSRPFLYTGIWFGVGGGLFAAVVALLAFFLLSGPFARLMTLYDSDFTLTGLTASDLLLLLVVAGALGLSGAWLSVLRHLRRIEPA
jgi:cell division transport system permease protein